MDKISVIIPVYNTGKYLPAAVEAVFRQQNADWELILADDGSSDDSLAVCRECAAKRPDRVKVLPLPHNGVSVARNAALDAATGDWVLFSDSDDFITDDCCEFLLGQARREQVDISCGALVCVKSQDREVRTNFFGAPRGVCDREAILRYCLYPFFRLDGADRGKSRGYLPIMLIRRSLIEDHKIRFIPGLVTMQDEAFLMQVLAVTEHLAISDHIVYNYVSRLDSSCGVFFKKKGLPLHVAERCWAMLAGNRLDVYERFRLRERYPDIAGELLLSDAFHRAVRDLFDPACTIAEKRARIAGIRRDCFEQLDRYGLGQARNIPRLRRFLTLMRLGNWPLMLALWVRSYPEWRRRRP